MDGKTRKWWLKKRWWMAGLMLLTALCIQFIPRFPYGPLTLYGDLTPEVLASPIAYVHLSDEASAPFQRGLRQTLADNSQLAQAIDRWPHVRDCLVDNERDKPEPDLRLIDWHQFSGYTEARVCVWRIFASLGTPERSLRWMEFHGFSTPSAVRVHRTSIRGPAEASAQALRDWVGSVPIAPTTGIISLAYHLSPFPYSESISGSWEEGALSYVQISVNIL